MMAVEKTGSVRLKNEKVGEKRKKKNLENKTATIKHCTRSHTPRGESFCLLQLMD